MCNAPNRQNWTKLDEDLNCSKWRRCVRQKNFPSDKMSKSPIYRWMMNKTSLLLKISWTNTWSSLLGIDQVCVVVWELITTDRTSVVLLQPFLDASSTKQMFTRELRALRSILECFHTDVTFTFITSRDHNLHIHNEHQWTLEWCHQFEFFEGMSVKAARHSACFIRQ